VVTLKTAEPSIISVSEVTVLQNIKASVYYVINYICLVVLWVIYQSQSQSQSHVTIDGQSGQYVSVSSPVLFSLPDVCYCRVFVGRPLWWEVWSVGCQSESAVFSPLSVYTWVFTFHIFNIQIHVHTLYLRPLSVRAQYSNLCPTNSSSLCHGSLRHLNGRKRNLRQE
jgi:hypothetical protein